MVFSYSDFRIIFIKIVFIFRLTLRDCEFIWAKISPSKRRPDHERDRLYHKYKTAYNLKQCIVILGDPQHIRNKNYVLHRPFSRHKPQKPVAKLVIKRKDNLYKVGEQKKEKSNKRRCHLCTEMFPSLVEMCAHLARVHVGSNKQPEDRHEGAGEECVFCPICARSFNRQSALHAHINMYHNEPQEEATPQRFRCHICKKRFNQLSDLRRHKNEKHSDINQCLLQCTECPCKFSKGDQLQDHMKMKHAKETTVLLDVVHTQNCYLCGVCDKRFEDLHEFRQHKRQHEQTKQVTSKSLCPSETKQPLVQQPVVQQQFVQQSVEQQQKVVQQPVVEQIVVQQPLVQQKVLQQPVIQPKVVQQPVVQQKVAQQPVVQQNVVQQPVVQQPLVQQPIMLQQPVVHQPLVEQPVVQQPVVNNMFLLASKDRGWYILAPNNAHTQPLVMSGNAAVPTVIENTAAPVQNAMFIGNTMAPALKPTNIENTSAPIQNPEVQSTSGEMVVAPTVNAFREIKPVPSTSAVPSVTLTPFTNTTGASEKMVCSICAQEFLDKEKYTEHLAEHQVYFCSICKEKFQSLVELKTHIDNHKHQAKGANYDNRKVPNSDNIKRADKSNTKGVYYDNTKVRCSYCPKIFINKKFLARHLQLVHQKCTCSVCFLEFPPEQLSKHYAAAHRHSGKKKNKTPTTAMKQNGESASEDIVLINDISEEDTTPQVADHDYSAKEPNTSTEKPKIYLKNLKDLMMSPEKPQRATAENKKKVVCIDCGSTFKGTELLLDHMRQARFKKCTQCNYFTCGVLPLNRHYDSDHRIWLYRCFCSMTFESRRDYEMHLVKIHENSKDTDSEGQVKISFFTTPVECGLCNAVFSNFRLLKLHLVEKHSDVLKT